MCSSTDSTDEPVRRRRTRIKEFDAVEENPLAIGSEIHSCRYVDTFYFPMLSTCHHLHHVERSRQGVSRPFEAIRQQALGLA